MTIVDRDERDEQNLITRRMQRSGARSGTTTNNPISDENQLSESHPESHSEGSILDIRGKYNDKSINISMCKLKCSFVDREHYHHLYPP